MKWFNTIKQWSILQRALFGGTFVFGTVFMVVLFFKPGSDKFNKGVFDFATAAVSIFTAACILGSARKMHAAANAPQRPWMIIGAAATVYAIASFGWTYDDVFKGIPSTFPSWVYIYYLIAQILIIVGVFCFFANQSVPRRTLLLLDSALMASSVGVLSWYFLVQQLWRQANVPLIAKLVGMAFPLVDLFALFGAVVLLSSTPNERRRRLPYWLLSAGITVLACGDTGYSFYTLNETYKTGSWVDLAFVSSWILICYAFLASLWERRRAPVDDKRLGQAIQLAPRKLLPQLTPYLTAGAAFSLIVWRDYSQRNGQIDYVVFGCGLWLGMLVIVRQILSIVENQRLTNHILGLHQLTTAISGRLSEAEVIKIAAKHMRTLFQADSIILLWEPPGELHAPLFLVYPEVEGGEGKISAEILRQLPRYNSSRRAVDNVNRIVLRSHGQPMGIMGVVRFKRNLDNSEQQMLDLLGLELATTLSVAYQFRSAISLQQSLQKSRDELENRVNERTVELQTANDELKLKSTILEAQGEASPDGILIVSEDGMVVSHNRRFVELWGITPEVLSSRSDSKYIESITSLLSEPDQFLKDVTYLYAHPDQASRDEILLKDGRTFDRYGAPVKGNEGNRYGRIWFFHDMTESKRINTLIHQAKNEAESANRAKSEFLSRMSHELRTPLNAILGFGQILDKENLKLLQKESVQHILKGGRHLLELINEILDISRVEAGRMELALEPLPLVDVVSEFCALVGPLARERNISILNSIVTESHCCVLADRQRLRQIFLNLLANAIKFNVPDGQVHISCVRRENARVAILVRDTGPGISSENLLKLFSPFERLNAETTGVEGTGLGLVLSQRLATAMGGTLVAVSEVGRGSTFTLELPEASADLLSSSTSDNVVKDEEAVNRHVQPHCVLCIEDNIPNLRLIEVILKDRLDITLISAQKGVDGLNMARSHEPDLILLDANLPDISGNEVLGRLKHSALTRDIPVIIVSADATPVQIELFMSAGAEAYLTKPVDVTEFLNVFDDILDKISSNNENVQLAAVAGLDEKPRTQE